MLKRAPIIILFTAVLIVLTKPSFADEPTIRVKIVDGAPSIELYSGARFFLNGKVMEAVKMVIDINSFSPPPPPASPAGRRLAWRAGLTPPQMGGGIEKPNSPLRETIQLKSRKEGLLWLNGKSYTGEIKIYKNDRNTLTVVNILPMETYLLGLLPGEMPEGWPIEALKAQAVTARTYAHYTLEENIRQGSRKNFDIRSTIEDQVFKGASHSGSKILTAVDGTRGEVITFHGKPVKTRFHSSCGGQTETSIHVWSEKDISESIKDPYCKKSPHNRWQITLTGNEIRERFKKHILDPGVIKKIEPVKFEANGRVAAVSIHGKNQTISLTGNNFRRYLGFMKVKSTKFTVAQSGNNFTFSGSGFGHGVGMCQWGAKGMAEKGHTYKEILGFYYPGTEIKRIY